ncbi:Ig-like domain-containing protein [Clostridium frigidicarnis]|uniref:Beta-N-acetylglucosaminidase n=1 Tax=Clostridium frigidicarnis TaxID=84698 RepID=A0A1I0VXM8_9CLOT|nr:Ig-like domain-containing protein [Clostridium frigidicarnis]SFA80720.1 Beta-N-acetylglucosaminidase [Clostridium frigidicarnis]
MKFLKKRLSLFLTFIFALTLITPVEIAHAALPFNGNLELPSYGSSMNGDVIHVEGWAVHNDRVKEVNVRLDGNPIGKATYGKERNDVHDAFSQYSDSKNSGFTYEMSLRDIKDGKHNIEIEVVSQSGSKGYLSTSFTKTKLPARMWVETPENYSNSNGSMVNVRGWGLNPSGVKEVKVYLNDKLDGSAKINLPREDVNEVYPGYPNGTNGGFEYDLNLNNGVEGRNKIRIETIGQDGSMQTQEVFVNYKKQDPKMWLELPVYDSTAESSLVSVYGWALNPSGVKEVKIYLNDKLNGSADLNLPRKDVDAVYPGYPNGENSGFAYDLNLSNGVEGRNKITAEVIGKDGTKQKQDTYVQFKKLDPKMWVEYPENYSVTGPDILDVFGWALDQSGIKEVKVLLDGNYVGLAKTNLSREDVDSAFPGYANGKNSGFSYKLSLSNIIQGQHRITVQAIGNDGKVQSQDRFVNLKVLENKMWVEEPVNGSNVNNTFKISGWGLNQSGVKEVNVYADDQFIGNAQSGLERNDIFANYPEYVNAKNSGFSYDMNIDTLTIGSHKITVEIVGNNGKKQTSTFSVNVAKKDMKMNVESLYENMNVNSNALKVSGWVLSDSEIRDVKVYVDNSLQGNATMNLSREDVDNIYPGYKNGKNSGFEYSLDVSKLSKGNHRVKVVTTSVDGKSIERSANINVIKSDSITYKEYTNSLDFYSQIQMNSNAQIIYDGGWRKATCDEIKYQMNPNNFVNDPVKKYIFYKLSYTDGITADQLNQVLVGKGVLEGKGAAFLEAGRRYNVNPVYLVSHSLLETGNGTSKLATGIIVNSLYKKESIKDENGNTVVVKVKEKDVSPRLTFNVYGIGAFDDDANFWGSDRAYREGWFTVEDAIIGGAKWIADGYISKGQDTLYKMRWDFDSMTMWHQYATDIEWATKQTSRIKALVDKIDNPSVSFEIPVFKK